MATYKSMEEIRAAHRQKMSQFEEEAERRKIALKEEEQALRIIVQKREQERIQSQRKIVSDLISEHLTTLTRKYMQLSVRDDYGIEDKIRWEQENAYFVERVVLPALGGQYRFITRQSIESLVDDVVSANVQKFTDRHIRPDSSTGAEYEVFCATILMRSGWKTFLTQASGDQGVDVIAEKNNICLAIQCKNYSSPVGNAAVQEIYAGMRWVHATHGAVVSNAPFTPQARQLAEKTDILLLHHSGLAQVDELIRW